ncbi:MAG: hypothetical protein RL095_327 [Verrucomicrobiota bacterium]|jgi:environmental stress-induced protein Ves
MLADASNQAAPMRLIKRLDQPVCTWAGGDSIQIAIFPEEASLARRDFDWRVSTASIRIDASFTPYPGFRRILLLLQGEGVALDIAGRRENLACQLQAIAFDGGDPVRGALLGGEIRDFNVISRKGLDAAVRVLSAGTVAPAKDLVLLCGTGLPFSLHSFSGSCFAGGDDAVSLAAGEEDGLVIEADPEARILAVYISSSSTDITGDSP